MLPTGGDTSLLSSDGELEVRPRTMTEMRPASMHNQSWGWAYQILPYLDLQNRWQNEDDDAVRGSLVPYYQCPSRQGGAINFAEAAVGTSHYVGNACSNCTPATELKQEKKPRKTRRTIGWESGEPQQDGVFLLNAADREQLPK